MATTVTVLFTDLVGSTSLLSRVGESAAEELRRIHVGLLREAVDAHGGREVKNLGDGLMVVFTSAADAAAAAVAMQQAFERHNRRAPEPSSIRIGIAAGDADEAEGDFFGVPVVQAARLCAECDGDEIICSDLVRMLAGSRVEADFEPIGELELKGLAEPVAASRLVWVPAPRADASPLPARLDVALRGGFAGRRAEYERMLQAWAETVRESVRRVVLLAGEPGIGKTTLTARFAREAHAGGALILYGRCDDDLGVPYQPWIEALGQLVEAAPAATLADHVAACGGHLGRLIPAVRTRTGVEPPKLGDSDGERFALFACVVDLVERMSERSPIVLVLDDLHWADRQSLQLLRHLVTTDRPLTVMVVGTFRDTDVAADHPMPELLAALHREPGVERLALRGLDDADLLELLEQLAGHELDHAGLALRDAMLVETAGNPFFVGEILRHLVEAGEIHRDEHGRWVGEIDITTAGLPVSVTEVIGRRIAALGADSERLLAHAAVIGRDFDVNLLATITDTDEDDAVDLCDAAVKASVLETTNRLDRYTFAHALIEHALYEGLSPSRRVRIHRKVAEAIEAAHGDDPSRVGELAHHWSAAAQPAGAVKAVHYAQLAGIRSLDMLAPDDALHWFSRALDLLDRRADPDPRERAEVLLGLGTAQDRIGLAAHRDNVLEAAHIADRIDAVDILVRAALATSRPWGSNLLKVDHDRVKIVERALERIADDDSVDRARLLARLAVEVQYGDVRDEHLALTEKALAAARRVGDPEMLAYALLQAAGIAGASATLETKTAWLTEAESIMEASTDPVLRWNLARELTTLALERGDGAAYRSHHQQYEHLCSVIHDATARWSQAHLRVGRAMLFEDLETAESLAAAALTLGTELQQPDAMRQYGVQASSVWFHQGRLNEFVDQIGRAVQAMDGHGGYRAFYAMSCARSDRVGKAVDLLTEELQLGFEIQHDSSWTYTLAVWADAAVTTGHRDAAEVLRHRLSRFADRLAIAGGATLMPAVAHWLGRLDHVLGRLDDADAWFTRADAMHRRVGSPLLVAYSDAAWAALLADRDRGDDRTRARVLGEQALAAATAGGYGYIESDARAVLERLSTR